ncbi:DUF4391 domain-containing protein [Streptococcus marmotae]|uniref:DUF4391 domain-containing protein n=1 Tax=Streptococcus marmotae TaxID=1825069 RepID=UPI0008364524|nr:DUF4391 domain-containing protein [Streptococcus marmotae]
MITLPERTRLPQEQVVYEPHKRGNSAFFDHLELSPKDRQELRRQIGKLSITHLIDTKTTNIPRGQLVEQLVVIRVSLLSTQLDKDLLKQLDMRLKFYPLFVLAYPDGREELLIHYKEALSREVDGRYFRIERTFTSQEELEVRFEGRSLDEVYACLVKDIGQEQLVAKKSQNLKEVIEKSNQLAKLEKQASSLDKKMRQEKSTKKAMELRKAYKNLLLQIKEIKGE